MFRNCLTAIRFVRTLAIAFCFISFQSIAGAGGFLILKLDGGRMEGRLYHFSEDLLDHLESRLEHVDFYYKDNVPKEELKDFTLGSHTRFDYHGIANYHVGHVRMLYKGHANHFRGLGPIWRIHPDDAKRIAEGYAAVIDRREWWRENLPTIRLAILYTLLGIAVFGVPLMVVRHRRRLQRIELEES